MKKIFIIIIVAAIIAFGLYFLYPKFAPTGGPLIKNEVYKNTQYGFQLTLPETWKGYTIQETTWQGNRVDDFEEKFTGPEIIIKNPQTTTQQQWQDIPIMVISPVAWDLIEQGQIAVSAAPVGPTKVGENDRYVFATPPRWYGFTDAIGWEEAVEIIKTFKAF